MKLTYFLILIFFLGCKYGKTSLFQKPIYYYDDVKMFYLNYWDTTKNIIILYDSYSSSTRESYSGWLDSDSVINFLKPSYSVYIFNIENICRHDSTLNETYQFLEKINPQLSFPYLALIDKERRMTVIPKEIYYHNKNKVAIIEYLKSYKFEL